MDNAPPDRVEIGTSPRPKVTKNRILAVYIHFPYCLSKCPYCDFNSHVRPDLEFLADRGSAAGAVVRGREQEWHKNLVASFDRQLARFWGNHKSLDQNLAMIGSIFFGGGTPSLLDPGVVAELIADISQRIPLAESCEITLEANPNSSEKDRFRDFHQAGINRLSLGVQSLDDEALRFLGRGHSAKEAIRAIEAAAKYFDRFSFDLIYARPDQSIHAWQQELRQALQFGATHHSLYQLTIEENTKFYQHHARGDFTLPDDNLAGEFYEITQAMMEEAGLPAYEISNHAKEGHESQHNLCYWRYGDYIGLGPGAHGRITDKMGQKFATAQAKLPETWQKMIAEGGDGLSDVTMLGNEERFAECLMMGLRLTEGIDWDNLRVEGGLSPDQLRKWQESSVLKSLVAAGFLRVTRTRLMATPSGRQRLNAVLREILSIAGL